MKRFLSLVVISTALTSPLLGQTQHMCQPKDYSHWLQMSLIEIQTVKVGMTRGDLLKLFTPDSGFGTGGRFRYQKSWMIAIDVTFATNNGDPEKAQSTDVITSISKPYLDFAAYD
jgi:hypothetical protein